MTTDGIKKLIWWYQTHYPKWNPKSEPQYRLEEKALEMTDAYADYTDAQIEYACRKWLIGDKARNAPYPRELRELAQKERPTALKCRKAIDCDGFVYDLDTQEILYSPYWTDDDPRLARYWESCAT